MKIKIFCTETAHDGMWGKNALVSFGNCEATVHLDKDVPEHERLRSAALKLTGMGFTEAELVGNGWNDERKYAFWQGFRDAACKNVLELGDVGPDIKTRMEIIGRVRDLINAPSDEMYPESFAEACSRLLMDFSSDKNALSVEIVKFDELDKRNFVGTKTVGKGSEHKPCVLVAKYCPKPSEGFDLGLVGKGITFDTGGYSLKPADYMTSMESDMGGAATCAGALALLMAENAGINVCFAACCAENAVSGSSFKPDDIIRYPNGVSVEVKNTDAEGRLVLADGLIEISKLNPRLLIDAATLTGAAKVALGREYNAVFSFDESLSLGFAESARRCREKAWPLPLEKSHKSIVKGDVADITNSAPGERYFGASAAAAFLSHFVPDAMPWLHVDLSASFKKSAGGGFQYGAMGHGSLSIARFALERLTDKQ